MRNPAILMLAGATCLSACASTPDVTVKYYPVMSHLSLRVVQSIICDKNNNAQIASSVYPTMAHSADMTKTPHSVVIRKLDNSMANTDVTFEFTEDGRLAGVNTSSTGKGGEIIKAVISLIPFVPGLAGGRPADAQAACGFIAKAGDGKPITLTFNGGIPFTTDANGELNPVAGSAYAFVPDLSSKVYFEKVKSILGQPCAIVEVAPVRAGEVRTAPAPKLVRMEPPAAGLTGDAGETDLALRQPALVATSAMQVDAYDDTPPANCGAGVPLWGDSVSVAQLGAPYRLPVPRAAAFGAQRFELALAPSGAVTKIKYGKDTGVADALGAATAGGAALEDSDAEKAARLNAEADLIAAQARLVKCRADPDNC